MLCVGNRLFFRSRAVGGLGQACSRRRSVHCLRIAFGASGLALSLFGELAQIGLQLFFRSERPHSLFARFSERRGGGGDRDAPSAAGCEGGYDGKRDRGRDGQGSQRKRDGSRRPGKGFHDCLSLLSVVALLTHWKNGGVRETCIGPISPMCPIGPISPMGPMGHMGVMRPMVEPIRRPALYSRSP